MSGNETFDVIIVGGSYAGLSAAMALGRALRTVLVIDDGKPCNRQTPHSHNFLTNDGKTPAEIAARAMLQVKRYDSIGFINGKAVNSRNAKNGFEIQLATGETFKAKKLIFATGINDLLPAIEGLPACWGISVLHCPYCHGYEVRYEKTGILGNGETAFDFTRLISNWTNDLTLFTNGPSLLTKKQTEKLAVHGIKIVEEKIGRLEHKNGQVQRIVFHAGSTFALKALYAPVPFEQHCKIPETLGCRLTNEGYLEIDPFNETSIEGIFGTGDNASKMRTVANAVAMGNATGLTISKRMILEEF